MVTQFLAMVIGWYLVIMSVLLLFRLDVVTRGMQAILVNEGLILLLAVLTLILGLLLVVSHSIWVMGWPVIITLFSWLVLFSGIIRLFCPEWVMQVGQVMLVNRHWIRIAAIGMLILGVFLLAKAYLTSF